MVSTSLRWLEEPTSLRLSSLGDGLPGKVHVRLRWQDLPLPEAVLEPVVVDSAEAPLRAALILGTFECVAQEVRVVPLQILGVDRAEHLNHGLQLLPQLATEVGLCHLELRGARDAAL